MWGRISLIKKATLVCLVVISTLFIRAQEPTEGIILRWGEKMTAPDLGFNARILRHHSEENCMQPEQEEFRYDWNSTAMREDIRSLAPKVMRFPGGTPSNFWNWYSETRQIIGEDGSLQELELCEASLLGRSISSHIGCSGNNLDMTAEWYDSVVTHTTVTLESYLNAMDELRAQGMDMKELYALNLVDPFYYIGSPHLEYVAANASPEVIKDTIKNNIVRKVERQLDKILLEKCGDCDNSDDEVRFELGNELFLQRYGKYFPRPDCFTMPEDSLCISCFPDIDFYAEVCEELVPMIRNRFSHAKIAMCGSRDILHVPWNQVLIDRFGQEDELQIDAVVFHYYPKTFHPDSLSYDRCVNQTGNYDMDKSLHYVQAHMDRLTHQKNLAAFDDTDMEIWITEFNSYDYSERCDAGFSQWQEEDLTYDSANWLHLLNIFSITDRFLTYRSAPGDPWSENSKGLDISMLSMHLFYGAERESAYNEDRQLTGAGMAMGELFELMNEADSVQRILLTEPNRINWNNETWSPAISEDEPLFLSHELSYADHTGNVVQKHTMDAYGWAFEQNGEERFLIVNLRDEVIEMDVTALRAENAGLKYRIQHVDKEDLTTHIDEGWASAHIQTAVEQDYSSVISFPAYSFAVIERLPEQLPSSLIEQEKQSFRIYPNPSNGVFKLQFKSHENLHLYTNVEVLDLCGRQVHVHQLSNGNQEEELDLSLLKPGMYLLRIGQEIKPIRIDY